MKRHVFLPRTCGNVSLTLDDRSRLDIRVISVRVHIRMMSEVLRIRLFLHNFITYFPLLLCEIISQMILD